jgi:MFS family permease
VTPQSRVHTINFCRKFTVNSIFFLFPLYLLSIGISGWKIGFVTACYAAAPLLFSFPVGWINDHLSIRSVIRLSLLTLTISFFLIGFTQNFLLLGFLFLVVGLANNALDVSTNSYFYKDQSNMDQNKKYAQVAFWLAFGIAAGTFSGGFLIHFTSFRVMFGVYALFLVIIQIITASFGPESFTRIALKEYRMNLLNRKTLRFAFMIFILTLHWGAEGTVYSPFLKEYFGLNNLQLSLYISLPLIMLALASLSVGFIRFRPNVNRRWFLISLIISGLGHILMVNPNVFLSFTFRILHEIGDGFLGALTVLYVSRLFEKRSIGGSSGLLLTLMTMGNMTGALVFSKIGFTFGLHYPFLISGGLLLGDAVYGWWLFRRESY